jgi:flagellar hook-length control protein FliK
MGLAPEGLTVSGTGFAPEAVFASEAGLASGTGLVPGPGFDPEAAFVPGTVFAPETGLAAGTAVSSETGLDAGTVFVPEAGLSAETVFASQTVIFPETAIAPETAIFTEAVSVTDGPVLPETADASAAVSLEATRMEAARTEAPAGENALPEEDAGLVLSAGSSGLTGEMGLARDGMAVSGETGDMAEVSVFSGQMVSEPTSSESTSSGQISAEPASSGQVPLESVLGATSPEQSGAAPLAVKPGTAAETEGSEAAEFTQGAYDGSPGVLAESPVNPQGQGQQEQGGSGSAFRRQTSQTSEQQSTLAQMLNQPVQRFFVNQPVNGSSPGAFAADMPEIVLQSFRSFENADGAQEMVIQLTPEALGRLTVKLVSQDGLLAIRILAQSPMTQRVLESGIASLKQALDQQGIRYQRIEVELDGRQMGHHQSGEEQASAWGSRQNQWAYDQQRFQGPRFYDAVEERMALAGEIPGEIPGAAAQQEEDAYEGKINYVV